MKKVSLLAASVAFALTGCGGSDGGSSSTTPNGVTITGFDGYFNQAVVFDDKNNDGILDVNSDIILGLTDSEGNLSLSDDEFASITSLALQTLTPGGAKQAALIASNPQLFAGKYTIDMDHPTQAMEHEVVFRAIPGEDIISPLTDLVVLEAGSNPTEQDIVEAKKTINESLGLDAESEDAFSDVITNGDAELHKTAQILTESKANDPTGYKSNPTGVAEEATKVVQDNPEKVNDENFKPIVDGDTNTDPVLNSKLVVNKDVKKHIDSLADALELDTHEGLNIELPLSLEDKALFNDADNDDIKINATITTKMQETITGVTISADNGGKLVITGTPSEVRETYIITLSADDKDALNDVVGAATTTLEIGIKLENTAPEANKAVKAEVQEWADSLELVQGVAVKDESISILDLFTDADDSELSYSAYASVKGLVVDVITTSDDIVLDVSGSTPLYSYSAGETITISATDGINTTYETFTLPEIAEQSLEADPEEVTELQGYINELLTSLKVGEEIDVHGIAIDELFETDSVSGVLEYYVGIEDDKEGYTSVPGVKVTIENDVYLKFSGTPEKAVTDGYFIIMAGVNVDSDDEIISEAVRFSIPAVAPADEVTPPPALGFTEAHFDNQEWKMGSFADNDGEIGYASLVKDEEGLMFCWGSNSDESYSGNMSDQWDNSYAPFAQLAKLDSQSDYMSHQDKDCMDVTLKDGKMIDGEDNLYEMLYQHTPSESEYQIILKVNQDELFWLDSTSTTFAQTTPASERIKSGFIDFDLTVESGEDFDPERDGYPLTYAAGKFVYAENSYNYESIKPTGFETPGNLNFELDNSKREALVLEETGEMSDEKTRYRYIQREFGDFYIGVKWSEEPQWNYVSAPEFGLYSYDQESMEKVIDKLPLIQD